MSSLFGSDQGYQALANNYLTLSLTPNDTLFGTDFASINGEGPLERGVNYASLVHNQKIIDGEENNPYIVSDYIKKINEIKKQTSNLSSSPLKAPNPTVYDIIGMFPQLKLIKSLIDAGDFKNELNGDSPVTFLAPTNEVLNNSLHKWLKIKNFSPHSEKAFTADDIQPYTTKYTSTDLGMPDWLYLKQMLKSHTLNYKLNSSDIIDKKLELYTSLNNFSVIADGTGRIVKELNFYQNPIYMLNNKYPIPVDRFTVEKIFEGKNGIVYVINGIFSPSITV
jgi:hypothetical protein